MYASENQNTTPIKGGIWHERIKEWEKKVDGMLDDMEAHPDYPSWEKERELGHLMLAGEIDATEALRRLEQQS